MRWIVPFLGQEKAWAMVVDGSLERRERRSAQCDAVCAIWKKVYICRRIGEIDGARFASSAGRAHPF